jgi:hypothetical protein
MMLSRCCRTAVEVDANSSYYHCTQCGLPTNPTFQIIDPIKFENDEAATGC